ncbi:nucleotidyltransferase family protein, partial [Desulfopila aestuarii]
WTRPINHDIVSMSFMAFSLDWFCWIQNYTRKCHEALLFQNVKSKYSLILLLHVFLQEAHSDIDLLVEFAEDADMFDLVGLSLFLEEKFHRKVDVIPKRALRQELQSTVLSEAIVV